MSLLKPRLKMKPHHGTTSVTEGGFWRLLAVDLDAQLTGGLWWCLQGNSAPWGVTAPHGNKGDTEKFLQQLDIIATLEGSGLMEQDSNQVVSPMSCTGRGLGW